MNTDAKIVIEGDQLLNLIDRLLKWESVEADWCDHIGEPMWDNWKRSPKKSDARRQSIVYGNCLETIKCLLGRREINTLMAQAREERKERLSSAD